MVGVQVIGVTLDSARTLAASFEEECDAVMVMSAVAAASSFSGKRPAKRGMSLAATLCAHVPPAAVQKARGQSRSEDCAELSVCKGRAQMRIRAGSAVACQSHTRNPHAMCTRLRQCAASNKHGKRLQTARHWRSGAHLWHRPGAHQRLWRRCPGLSCCCRAAHRLCTALRLPVCGARTAPAEPRQTAFHAESCGQQALASSGWGLRGRLGAAFAWSDDACHSSGASGQLTNPCGLMRNRQPIY